MCGSGGVHGTFGGSGCAITGTTFNCGATFCLFNAATFRVVGAFFCSNVSGTFDLKRSDNVNCCTLSAMNFSAALPGGPPMMELDTPTLPDGSIGASYGEMVTAMGGTTPYDYSVSNGALPGRSLSRRGDGPDRGHSHEGGSLRIRRRRARREPLLRGTVV